MCYSNFIVFNQTRPRTGFLTDVLNTWWGSVWLPMKSDSDKSAPGDELGPGSAWCEKKASHKKLRKKVCQD